MTITKTVKLAIIIVNYRTAALTIDSLVALLDDPALPEGTHIMMVDGASGDGSVQQIADAIEARGAHDRVSLLPLDVNGGFPYANNRGIEAIRERFGEADYYLLLNPDTVVRPSAVSILLEFMEANPAAGIAGSLLEDPDGTPQACAFRFPSIASEFESALRLGPVSRLLRRWNVVMRSESDKPYRVDWVSGASMMVRKEVLSDVGLMDEGYFLYYDELDFQFQVARAGWERWSVPQSRIVHLVGQSTGVTGKRRKVSRRPAYWFESRKRFFVKSYGRLYTAAADLAWVIGKIGWDVRCLVTGHENEDPPMLLRDFLRHSLSNGKR